MTVLAELALHTHAQRARLFADGPEPKPRHVTAGEVIAAVLEQHQSRDVAALTAVALENLPSDYGGIRRALQELVAGEIRRHVEGRPTILPLVAAPAAEDDSPLIDEPAGDRPFEPTRERHREGRHATDSTKWQATAAVANDPLQAQVMVGNTWRTWASLTALELRGLARRDETKATQLLARVVQLDALAADMDASGAVRLRDLPDAAARIEALGC